MFCPDNCDTIKQSRPVRPASQTALSPGRMLVRLFNLCSVLVVLVVLVVVGMNHLSCPGVAVMVLVTAGLTNHSGVSLSLITNIAQISPSISHQHYIIQRPESREGQLRGKTSLNIELQREEMAEEAYMLGCQSCPSPLSVCSLQSNYLGKLNL